MHWFFERRLSAARRPAALVGLLAFGAAASAIAEPVVFPDTFDGKPLATPLKAGEIATPALLQFKASGVNAYNKDTAAKVQGRALYEQWCMVCHNADGKGKMGPSLLGPTYSYKQTATDPGMFGVIYGGAAGAMQPFSKREITQDEILKVMAYIRSLPK